MKFPHLPVSDNAGITRNFEHLQTLLTNGVHRGTSLPGNPRDGQEYDYVASAANGTIWRFRYRSGSASTHKWEFIGGSVLGVSAVGGETKLASNAFIYQEITGSPSLTVPLSGVYSTTLAVQTLSLKEAAGAAEQLNFYAGTSTTAATSAFGAFITNFQFSGVPVCMSYPIPNELVVGSVLKVYAGGNNFKKWGFEGVGVGLIPVRVG